MPNDAFGIPEVPLDEDPELPWLQDPKFLSTEGPETPTEGTEETPVPAPEETPQGGGTEPPPQEEPTPPADGEPETPVEEAPKLYAGKYVDIPGFEKGYRELRDLQRRSAERANTAESRVTAAEEQAQQLETMLRQAVPLLQQAQAIQQREAQARAQGYDPGYAYEQMQPQTQLPNLTPQMVDQIIANRLGQLQEQTATSAEAQELQRRGWESTQAFFAAHPEVVPEGDLDRDLEATIRDLNEAWQDTDFYIDITNPQEIELAYEATTRPALAQILRFKPEYSDTDAGMQLARYEASVLESGTPAYTQQTATVPASQVGKTVGQRKPVTESASSKAPAGAQTPLDDFDQAVLEYNRSNKGGLGGSIFA